MGWSATASTGTLFLYEPTSTDKWSLQVCRRLNVITHEHSVWLSLFLRYSSSSEERNFYLEKPLHQHSSNELERIILRRNAVDRCWPRDDIPPTLHKKFVVDDVGAHCSHLLKGGRWFIAGTFSGSVQYFDLDAEIIVGRTLIPSPYEDEGVEAWMRISVDLDVDSPYLSFNIAAFWYRTDRRPGDQNYGRRQLCPVQVWHVSVEQAQLSLLASHLFLVASPSRHSTLP